MPIIQRDLFGTLDLTRLHRNNPTRYPLLLQSVAGGNAVSRWDILFFCNGEGLLCRNGETQTLNGEKIALNFLDALDNRYAETQNNEHTDLPFSGGWALYLGYEMVAQIEPSLSLPKFTGPLPDALALRCPAALLFDKQKNRSIAIAEAESPELLELIVQEAIQIQDLPANPVAIVHGNCVEEAPQEFVQSVHKILQYLNAGDVFQVNVSRAWNVHVKNASASDVYHSLCQANPSPFAGILQYQDWALISSSPERLVSVQNRFAQTRPIAGTRARKPGDDEIRKINELMANPKERAEHVMLIDLERNDLSRVCEPGTVRVDELMSVESYQHVHHIVSNVNGKLRTECTPGQVLAAVFPGGTITGCPKVRCMEIIAELEQTGRGPYTGALGYLNHNGDMDFNILIRSLWMQNETLQLRAGAGIVFDSVPEFELQETRTKAKGVLRALGIRDA